MDKEALEVRNVAIGTALVVKAMVRLLTDENPALLNRLKDVLDSMMDGDPALYGAAEVAHSIIQRTS